MIGVRPSSRGSRAAQTGRVCCLLVVVALLATGPRFDRTMLQGADARPGPKSVDPFLAEDTEAPAADEIPAIPDGEPPAVKPQVEAKPNAKAPAATPAHPPKARPASLPPPDLDSDSDSDSEPALQAPRMTRGIKKTALPKLDQESSPELPADRTAPESLPSLRKKPLGGNPGWKSKSPAAVGGLHDSNPKKPAGPNTETARFEKEVNPNELSEPLSAIMIEGNKTIKKEEILKLIKTRVGRVPDAVQIKEDVRTLSSKRGWFYNVETRIARSKEGPVLVFRVLERPLLQKVTYVGNKKFKDKALTELTGLKVGSGYDAGANREAARRIESHYREKGYLHAQVALEKGNSKDDREVVFKIDEGPKVVVTKVSFKGHKFVEGGVLKTHLKTKTRILWLFGGKFDPMTIPEDKQAIKQYYHDLGFFDIVVTEKQFVSDDKANVHIEYTIDEGVRYKVRNVEFVGNRVIPREKLIENARMHENDFYNARFVNADKEKIEAQYGELGRVFATVNYRTISQETPGIVDLVYDINEDRPYRIGQIHVHINGDHPHTKESVILNRCTFKPGDLANPAKVKQSEQRLKNTQIFAGSMPGQGGGPGGEPPSIRPVLPEGYAPRRQQYVSRGQSDARTETPRSPSPSQPQPQSQPQSKSKSKPQSPSQSRSQPQPQSKSQSRPQPAVPGRSAAPPFAAVEDEPLMESSGIFRGQSFGFLDQPQEEPFLFRGQSFEDEGNPDFDDAPAGVLPRDPFFPEDEPPAYIDYDITVSEGQTGRLSFGVGVNSNMGLIGNATLQENNFDILRPPTSLADIIDGTAFRGGGQQFTLQAMPGLYLSQYSLNWTDPYFLDQNITLGVGGNYFTRIYPNWFETRAGGNVRFGHQFSPYLSGLVALRGENVMISNPSLPVPPDYLAVMGNNFLSTVKPSLVHDTRDSAFLPGSGHLVEASYEQAFGNFSFPKFNVNARQYFLVKERPDGGSRRVISVSANVGWTGNDTPFFERFFAGGFNTFRGFFFYGVTPTYHGVATGGFFQALGSVEYLHPLTADNTIQVVAFSDFGTVDTNVTFNAFRVSVGAGFRLTVPMMGPLPIAVDFAVPLMRQPTDIPQVVSFNMGFLR